MSELPIDLIVFLGSKKHEFVEEAVMAVWWW